MCKFCAAKVCNDTLPCLSSLFNDLDPGETPDCLKHLTMMEKRLISKVHVFMTLVLLPGRQFAENGLAIDFPVEVAKTVTILPRSVDKSGIFTVEYNEFKVIT